MVARFAEFDEALRGFIRLGSHGGIFVGGVVGCTTAIFARSYSALSEISDK